jgi:DNA-binding LacI/PurR family transcriptional regulator
VQLQFNKTHADLRLKRCRAHPNALSHAESAHPYVQPNGDYAHSNVQRGATMPVTTYDIAQKLGISQSTVSRILHGAKNYRVAEKTRTNVMALAREMGYRPNSIARSLRRRRTNLIGFYSGYGYLNARNAYIASVIGALQQACDAETLDILLHGAFRQRTTDQVFGELVDGRIDGLFLHTLATDPIVNHLVGSSLPVVAISDVLPGLASVVADDRDGIRQTVEHLFERGHRRIAYLAPEPRFISVENRIDAFQYEMRARGVQDACVIRNTSAGFDIPPMELLEMGATPTAIICWNDLTAANLLVRCRESGMRVPADLAVVGFDDVLDRRLMAQALTTVAVPWDSFAQQAVSLLLAQIRGDDVPRVTCVPVRLVPGETT